MSSPVATARFSAPARASRSPSSVARLLANGAPVVLLICCAIVSVAAAGGASSLIDSPPAAFPAWITGPLSGLSRPIGRPEFLVVVSVMWLAYGVVLATCDRLRPAFAVSVVLAAHVVFVLAPPLLSTDIFSYLAYGRLGAVHGLDPYVYAPSAAPHDPVYPLVGPMWRNSATAYGPLFTLISYPLARLSLPDAVWALKTLAGLASLACVGLTWSCARRLGRPGLRPALFVGLNPMLLVYTVGGGHNDLLMLSLMLVATRLSLAAGDRASGLAILASVCIKASTVVAVPLMLVSGRRARGVLVGGVLGLALTVAVSIAAFDGQAWRFVSVVGDQQALVGADNFPSAVGRLLGTSRSFPIIVIARALLGLIYVSLLIAVRRGADWITATGWTLVTIAVTTSFLMPWYTVWALPLAALSGDRRLQVATVFVEILFFVHQLAPLLAS